MRNYKVKLTDKEGNTMVLEIMSTDIEWSMKEYQRNRDPFTWEIIQDDPINI